MSQRLLDLLIKHEGFKSHAYKDTGGVLHIGIGRNIDEGGMGISQGEAYHLSVSYTHLTLPTKRIV